MQDYSATMFGARGVFIPLVVELLSFQSVASRPVLQDIAVRTTTRSGIFSCNSLSVAPQCLDIFALFKHVAWQSFVEVGLFFILPLPAV